MFLLVLLFLNAVFFASAYYLVAEYPLLVLLNGLILFCLAVLLVRKDNKQRQWLIKSLEQGFLSFNDGDFSISLPDNNGPKKYRKLVRLFNLTGDKLRRERQHLYQREMLLDKVLNASSVLTILVDHRNTIVFTNQAAQKTFSENNSLLGENWDKLLITLPAEFQSALKGTVESVAVTGREQMKWEQGLSESIITINDDQGQQQSWHITQSSVRIHQARHTLYLFKSMTEELSRQEITTWKKVIRVLSHELNNSIAPISSMCHSGTLLAEKLDEPKLDRVFTSIARRISHLDEFIKGYASLTKLTQPQKSPVDWLQLIEHIKILYSFKLTSPLPEKVLEADSVQLEQVLINIIKNAHEADPSKSIELSFDELENNETKITVTDQGPGMSEEVIKNALLPFYSTKHSGSGLGLALCREIVEAHRGKLVFNNLKHGGFCISVILPN